MAHSKIFISHAGADEPLATALLDLLTRAGLQRDRVFYSSDRSTGIPAGRGSRAHLQATLAEQPLVLSLITPTFVTRPMCWMELGAAWGLDLRTFPIIVPPMTRSLAADGLGDAQVHTLGRDRELSNLFDDLHGRIAEDLGVSLPVTTWNPAVSRFRAELPALVESLGSSPTASGDGTRPASAEEMPSKGSQVPEDAHRLSERLTAVGQTILPGRRGPEIVGTVRNDSTSTVRFAALSGTFFDADGHIVGTTGPGIISDLPSGGTKRFRLVSRENIPAPASFDVQVDSEN